MNPRIILSCLLVVSVSVSVPTTAQNNCNYTDVNALILNGLRSYFNPWCGTNTINEALMSTTGSYKLDCNDLVPYAPEGIGYGLLDTSGGRGTSTTNVPKNVVYEAIAPDPLSEAKPTSFEIDGHRISSFEDPCNASNEVADFMTDVLWGNATCAVTNVTNEIVGFMNDVWGRSSCTFIEDLPLTVYECKREGYDWSYARYEALGWYGVRNQEEFWSEHTIWDRAFRVGCMHPDPCNALQRVKEATNRVLDPDYDNSRNTSSVCETCSDYCNDSCSYYCSATAISPRISASWVTMPAILAAIALAVLS